MSEIITLVVSAVVGGSQEQHARSVVQSPLGVLGTGSSSMLLVATAALINILCRSEGCAWHRKECSGGLRLVVL